MLIIGLLDLVLVMLLQVHGVCHLDIELHGILMSGHLLVKNDAMMRVEHEIGEDIG